MNSRIANQKHQSRDPPHHGWAAMQALIQSWTAANPEGEDPNEEAR